jgi:peptidoglycan hydrolase-like protein with peptidoglycan-binding domain
MQKGVAMAEGAAPTPWIGAAYIVPATGFEMTLHKIAIAVAALSFAGGAIATGNQATTNPSSDQSYSTNQQSQQAGSTSAAQSDPTLVRQAQQALKQRGFDAGAVDGQMGPSTESALKNFQQAQGLPQSGNLDDQTLAALGVQQGGSQGTQSQGATQQTPGMSQGSAQSHGAMQDRGSTEGLGTQNRDRMKDQGSTQSSASK